MSVLKEKRFGIIGGSGYLGSRLADALVEENEVRIIDTRIPPFISSHPNYYFVECDVTDAAACLKVIRDLDIVFHRAGLAGNRLSMKYPQAYYEVNILGTLNVLEACLTNGIKRFIFDSTEMVYGNRVTSPVTEDQAPDPTSLYGATKLISEAAVRMYDQKFGLSTLIFRYSRTRDAFKSDSITTIAQRIINGEEVTIYDSGRQTIDFVDIDDLVRANIAAAALDVRNEVINISSGEGYSLNQIVEMIQEQAGRRAKIRHQALDPSPPSAEHQFCPEVLYMSVEKAENVLGWSPAKNLRSSIEETVRQVTSLANGEAT